jgi:antitoxin HicB
MNAKDADYPFEIRPLSASEGGGYLISYPDFA